MRTFRGEEDQARQLRGKRCLADRKRRLGVEANRVRMRLIRRDQHVCAASALEGAGQRRRVGHIACRDFHALLGPADSAGWITREATDLLSGGKEGPDGSSTRV